jgi:hypothetical protein
VKKRRQTTAYLRQRRELPRHDQAELVAAPRLVVPCSCRDPITEAPPFAERRVACLRYAPSGRLSQRQPLPRP